MRVGTIKLICWLASIGMATALVLSAFQFLTNIEEHKIPVSQEYVESVLREDVEIRVTVPEVLSYNNQVQPTFVLMNWTGKPEEKPKPENTAVTAPTAPPKRPVADYLRILMIRVDTTDPGGSLAAADYLEAQGDTYLELQVGDHLPEPHDYAIVHAITERAVEFAFTDNRENELLEPKALSQSGIVHVVDPNDLKLPTKDGIPLGALPPRLQTTRLVARNHYELGVEDMADFGENYARILTEDVRTSTYFDADGKRAGVQLDSVKQGSVASRHGALEGDVIISVNGHKVSSEQEAISFVKKNADKYKVWQVKILRLGREETIVYNTPE